MDMARLGELREATEVAILNPLFRRFIDSNEETRKLDIGSVKWEWPHETNVLKEASDE